MSEPWILDIIPLITVTFQLIPSTALLDWQQIVDESELSPLPPLRAKQIYDLESGLFEDGSISNEAATPVGVAWQSLMALSVQCVTIATSSTDPMPSLELLTWVISSLSALVTRIKPKVTSSRSLEWEPDVWMLSMLSSLKLNPPFELVDELVTIMASLTAFKALSPAFRLNNRVVKRKLLNSVRVTSLSLGQILIPLQIFGFFEPHCVPYHARAVQLFWLLHSCVSDSEIEGLISERLVKPDASINNSGVEAFGVLWRFSGKVNCHEIWIGY